jgi:murein DD-endopeptidase MepM/ murein hydrolase activator NlpD
MPDGDGAGMVRTFRIPRWRITLGRTAPAIHGGLLVLLAFLGAYAFVQMREGRIVKGENVRLRNRLEAVDERVDALARLVERVGQFDARIRKATMLSDPERNLAMGPVGGAVNEQGGTPAGDVLARTTADLKRDLLGPSGADRAFRLIEERVQLVGEQAQDTETSVRGLQLYLEDQQSLLSATPSLNPARGWRTSGFGFRVDPYTGLKAMHSGVDISTEMGREVIAPGDALVTFVGPQGAYGNVVILDHGHGLTSVFGHLSESHVKVGDEVKRGAVVAAVGNSGRSTGPHLHYEIRLNGVPQDPDRFILE